MSARDDYPWQLGIPSSVLAARRHTAMCDKIDQLELEVKQWRALAESGSDQTELEELRELRAALEAVELHSTSANGKHLFISFDTREPADKIKEVFK